MGNYVLEIPYNNICYVLNTGSTTMDSIYQDLQNELAEKGFQGSVYFDMLTSNGSSPDLRYFHWIFSNGKFLLDTIIKLGSDSIPPGLIVFTNYHISRNPLILFDSTIMFIEIIEIYKALNIHIAYELIAANRYSFNLNIFPALIEDMDDLEIKLNEILIDVSPKSKIYNIIQNILEFIKQQA